MAVQEQQLRAPASDWTKILRQPDLLFAGGGTVKLTVECLEARLQDLGAAWAARARPAHELGKA